jgi:hypothetical protein
MHNFSSENRLISQNMPEAPRAPMLAEAARARNEVQSMFDTFEQIGREVSRTITPEQKRQLENVAREFVANLGQIRNTFFDSVRQEVPRLGQYAQLGGQFGNRAPGMQWNPAQQSLQLDPAVFGFNQQSFPFNVGNNGRQNMMVMDRGGQASVVDVFGDDWDAMFGDGDSWIIDQDGMHEIDDVYSEGGNQYVEQNAVQTGTSSALDNLRRQLPQQPGVQAQPAGQPAQQPGQAQNPRVRPEGNLPLRPGETKESKRAELQRDLAEAQREFNAQRGVVANLERAGAPANQITDAKKKLRDLSLKISGIEGEIKALEGQVQPDFRG